MATSTEPIVERRSLPWSPLLALGTAVFITALTETLPAGVLPEMSTSLRVGAAAMGQTVTIYAAGTALTAIPLSRATARVRRKRLLLIAMSIFAVANTATAAAPNYPVALAARFVAGVAAGLAWALLAGYARRLAPPGLEGRAIAVAMTGIPLALSLGVPIGTFVGQQIGWRASFTGITVVTIGVLAWILTSVPDASGEASTAASSLTPKAVLRVPGVLSIMTVVVLFVLGHTVIYAFIAPYLAHAGLGSSIDLVLLVFGAACLVSIWFTGRHIDAHLRSLALLAAALFVVANFLFILIQPQALIWVAAALWGLGWGGAPTLLQTAGGQAGMRHSADAADTTQAILVTLWNAAMAAGGILGGLLLSALGAVAIPAVATILGLLSLMVIVRGSRHAFPAVARPSTPI